MIYIFDLENVAGKAFTGIENLSENDKVVIFYSQNSKNISIDTHLKIVETPVEKEYVKVKIGGRNALDFQLSTYIGYVFGQSVDEEITIISGDMGFDYVVDYWKDRGCIIKRRLYIGKVQQSAMSVENDENNAEIDTESVDFSENLEQTDEIQQITFEVEESENLIKFEEKNEDEPFLGIDDKLEGICDIIDEEKQPQELVKTFEKINTKHEINKALCKKIGTQTAGEVYKMIDKYKTKQGINNALCKKLGSQTAGEVYKTIKPLIEDKKGR